jgi:hypothetical protein
MKATSITPTQTYGLQDEPKKRIQFVFQSKTSPKLQKKKKLATNKVEASSQPCKRKQANIRNPKENHDAQRQTRNRVKAWPYI